MYKERELTTSGMIHMINNLKGIGAVDSYIEERAYKWYASDRITMDQLGFAIDYINGEVILDDTWK